MTFKAALMKKLPDFEICANGEISNIFLSKHIRTFEQAMVFIRNLSYGRNANKDDLTTVFSDNKGTCSTKHAVLKQLADENGFRDIKLMLGIFKMNGKNTPRVAETLSQNNLEYIPEAHNYLKFKDEMLDFTRKNSSPNDFADDLLFEIEIKPNEINLHKNQIHKDFLGNWLSQNRDINYSLEALWKIRESCINALSE